MLLLMNGFGTKNMVLSCLKRWFAVNNKEIQEKYERSFKELTDTLSPQQIKLFECWFEVACLLYTTTIIENRSLGLQEGLRVARELLPITEDEEHG